MSVTNNLSSLLLRRLQERSPETPRNLNHRTPTLGAGENNEVWGPALPNYYNIQNLQEGPLTPTPGSENFREDPLAAYNEQVRRQNLINE